MAPKLLRVDQPSVRDLETTISSLDESIAEFETQDHKDLGVRIKLADASPENALVTDHERKIFDRMETILVQLRKEKTAFKQYLDPRKRYLGEVVFGSGLHCTCRPTDRTEGSVPSIQDWALIRVTPDREGENKVREYYATRK